MVAIGNRLSKEEKPKSPINLFQFSQMTDDQIKSLKNKVKLVKSQKQFEQNL
jgi:hypothetical protein